MSDGETDHAAALARLPAGEMTRLTVASDARGLAQLVTHLGLLALTGAIVAYADGWWALPAMLLHGIILVFLFAAVHESIHQTAFRSAWLNRTVANLAGFLIFLPPIAFSFFHFAHHRHTHDPERDPELADGGVANMRVYLVRLTGWHYWTGQGRAILATAFGSDLPGYVPKRATDRVRREARLYLAGYVLILAVSIAAQSALLLWLWVVPLLLGQPALRAYLMAEHTACPLVPDMLRNTRTTFTNRLIRWLAWEMPNHTAHHAAPRVPFHKLPVLTAHLRADLRATANGYPDAHGQILTDLTLRSSSSPAAAE
ncbi:MAG: fatty acid desaturase [Pseudomonadota bacterium]